MRIKKNNQKGFTLVEVLVGGALLAIASMVLFSGFALANAISRRSEHIKTLGNLAFAAVSTTDTVDPLITKTQKNGSISVTVNGSQTDIPGVFISAYDNQMEVVFDVFIPDV